ncbi:MAG: aminodeoxychorismate synthase component I [Burkholderiales bacterium RIFCSPLOWO2_02_FULL_57_36]|nr:MAG: aminodeoxychorismate synthase component I [Burkholderiales bacterium RIFCSPLOWO2_02_FULL_57_36]
MQTLDLKPGATADCFALLDDCDATAAMPTSRLYTGHLGTLSCRNPAELDKMLDEMQHALRQGRHAVALFSYALGEQLHDIAPRNNAETARILLFEHCARLSAAEAGQWLHEQARPTGNAAAVSHGAHAGITRIRASVSEDEFNQAIAAIHAYIEAGDTYQTNYTYRLHFNTYGSLHALYLRLRDRQPVPYGALIGLPDGRAVLSFSPELFVRHRRGHLTTCPMKGTTAASGNEQTDSARAATLANDPKNRAENLMIVDLLRNDLGRIAVPGSVKVPELFKVNRYGSVLQMTSTVVARTRDNVTLTELFRALYPCGSITGAPKRRTMQIIRELESTPRDIYTGAIGWFDAPDDEHAIDNFCLSVPIRTLLLQAPHTDGLRVGEMGVGAGIVHDSKAADEYAECRLKASFLTGLPNDFDLFETMHATRADGCRHLDRHMQRLQRSAAYFGFAFDEQKILSVIEDACARLSSDTQNRLKLTLSHDGVANVQTWPLTPLSSPVRLMLADHAVLAEDVFLHHKTTVRERYDAAWRTAEARGAFDMLFFNTHGELTEGARSSVFVKLHGRWYTPPLSAGVLPGVMRAVLLADPAWNASEKTLTVDDLRNADQVMVCNALRGALPATVDWQAHASAE